MKSIESYSTQNLYEAAFCLYKGLKLSKKEIEGKKAALTFVGKDASSVAFNYYNKGRVQAKALMDCYRTIKDLVFDRQF